MLIITGRSRPAEGGWYASGLWRMGVLLAVAFPATVWPSESVTAIEEVAVERLIITVTAADLYLCGEGHGGLYGCIDEAKSRSIETVRVRASNAATTQAVQDLLREVHANGFVVELDTFYE